MKHAEMEDRSAARAKVTEHALNYPLIVEDDIQLTNILMQFGSYNLLAAYCNPKDYDRYD